MIESIVDPLDPVLYGWRPVSASPHAPKFEGPHVFRVYEWEMQNLHTAWDPTSGRLIGWYVPGLDIRPHVADGELFEQAYMARIDRREPWLRELGDRLRSALEAAQEYETRIRNAASAALATDTPEALRLAGLTYTALVAQWRHHCELHKDRRFEDYLPWPDGLGVDVPEVGHQEREVNEAIEWADRELLPTVLAALGVALGSR